MSRAKKEPWRCKVRDERTGARCLNKARGNTGMCERHNKLHKTTGAKTEAGKARIRAAAKKKVTHGIYEKWYSEEEQALVDQIKAANMRDNELVSLRIALRRIYGYITRLEAGERIVDGTDETNEADGVPIGPDGRPVPGQPPGKVRVTRKTSNLTLQGAYLLADRYTSRIAHVEREIADLLHLPHASGDPHEEALALKDQLRGMMDLSGGPAGEAAWEEDEPPSNGNGKNGNGQAK